ncbi:MAG: phosphopantothenoylcysteine decarboxylase, partial [Ignavibacteriaceae bacterium]
DFRPKTSSNTKIKKENKLSEIKLAENEDILSSLKKENKIVVGFALETDNEIKNAKSKLKNKNLDMIVLNSLTSKESGFEFDTNKITIIYKNGKKKNFPLQSKFQAANNILSGILNQ